ncbi:MAG: dienelactone hydrolase family protein [Clostridia bacterium]|nr:dienelactone hydrolase family protein [Clostridia bacterium]
MKAKILSILLCLCLAISIFAGCGGDGGDPLIPGTHGESILGGTGSLTTDPNSSELSTDTEGGSTVMPDPELGTTTTPATEAEPENPPLVPDPEPEPEPEPDDTPAAPINYTIVSGGTSQYTIVYDDSNGRITKEALEFVAYLKDTHGIDLPCKPASEAGAKSGREIIIGEARSLTRLKYQLKSTGDFIITVWNSDLVFLASNDKLYEYMFDIMEEKLVGTVGEDSWVVSSLDTMQYTSSDYKDVSYIEYIMGEKTAIDSEIMEKIFEKHTYTGTNGSTIPYRMYIPHDYNPKGSYPVLLFLHGAGERGTDNSAQLKNAMLNLLNQENSPLLNAIVIAPQCPWNDQWVNVSAWTDGTYDHNTLPISSSLECVVEILDAVGSELPADTSRYYAMGLSMGGYGTWDLAVRYPDKLAGIVPICGGGDDSDEAIEGIKDLPIYTVHGSSDNIVPYANSTQKLIAALEKAGSTSYTVELLSGYGHNVWDYTSKKAEIMTWLFSQSKATE